MIGTAGTLGTGVDGMPAAAAAAVATLASAPDVESAAAVATLASAPDVDSAAISDAAAVAVALSAAKFGSGGSSVAIDEMDILAKATCLQLQTRSHLKLHVVTVRRLPARGTKCC